MKEAAKILGLGLIGALILLIIFILFGNYLAVLLDEDVYYVSYPTYGAAVNDHLPESTFMPPSASDIRYLSWSIELWLSFNFDGKEISRIRTYCGEPVHGEIKLAPEPPELYFIDWPEEITGDAPVRAENIPDYEFYRCDYGSQDDIIAVDTEKGKAYYFERR